MVWRTDYADAFVEGKAAMDFGKFERGIEGEENRNGDEEGEADCEEWFEKWFAGGFAGFFHGRFPEMGLWEGFCLVWGFAANAAQCPRAKPGGRLGVG